MKTRNVTPRMIDAAFREVQVRYPGQGQFDILRCDKAGDFESNECKKVFTKYGAVHEFAETDVYEHNGSAERIIRTLECKVRALLYESGYPRTVWEQLTAAATWLYNRTPHSGIDFVTPYELFYNKVPDVSNVRIIGSCCYVYRPKVPKGHKWDRRSEIQYLIGFTSTGYRTYDAVSKKTTEECIVSIDETRLYKDNFPSTSDDYRMFCFPEKEMLSDPETNNQIPQSNDDRKLLFLQEGDLLKEFLPPNPLQGVALWLKVDNPVQYSRETKRNLQKLPITHP